MLSEILTLDSPALISGLVAATCLVAAPTFSSRRMILVAQLAAGISFATHYALLGISVASLVNVLGAVQTAAAIFATRSRAMDRIGYALVVLMVGVGIWFWQGPISFFSVAATAMIAFGRMQSDQFWLRLLILFGGAFWIVHDFLAGAWIPLVADIGTAVAGIAALSSMFVRIRIEWQIPMRQLSGN